MDAKDYEVWDLRESFSIKEAAALWCDVNPSNASEMAKPEISGRIAAMANVFAEAMVNRKLRLRGFPLAYPLHKKDLKDYAKLVMKKPRFLFPEERGDTDSLPQIEVETKKAETPIFMHSPDYRSVNFRGKMFTFTSRQAQAVEILHEAYNRGTPDVGKTYILEALDSNTTRLKDAFQKSEAWGTLIIQGKRKGLYRLNI